ncbi:MAG: hypothetical protein A3G34_01935 [Candidatus Lindowbacteria bacterium RIFCSPLOWO2_12_FULL_62_27]|nr:MAG: hypothetical protein A3I06_11455 [Candidatus Lindowbacteria bacterium RIFCSPLOWO2_02_FULL_62_12]OGH59069.1 MAG: hypothetical protein A3G34_01935 [Candidatus Lindowbacteria bacterium RIFCSPLOWO2_12_FULL_62_27]
MCGRFSCAGEDIEERFEVDLPKKLCVTPRYNIAPGQDSPVVVRTGGGKLLRSHKWGLIPSWAKEEAIGYKMINARAETLAEKPAYRKAFERRRCLVPADGFYEWLKEGRLKLPVRFVLKSRETFAFAGLWETWKKPSGEELLSFTIITTHANDLIKPVHERMPVILLRENEEAWLDPNLKDTAKLQDYLTPYPPDRMEAYKVSTMVNSAKNDRPECIAPVAKL